MSWSTNLSSCPRVYLKCLSDPITALLERLTLPGFLKKNSNTRSAQASASLFSIFFSLLPLPHEQKLLTPAMLYSLFIKFTISFHTSIYFMPQNDTYYIVLKLYISISPTRFYQEIFLNEMASVKSRGSKTFHLWYFIWNNINVHVLFYV